MPIGFLFWVLMVIALFVVGWAGWPDKRGLGGSLLMWCIVALLGWKVFGPLLGG